MKTQQVRNWQAPVVRHEFTAIAKLQCQPATGEHDRPQKLQQAKSFEYPQTITVDNDAATYGSHGVDAFENRHGRTTSPS